MNGPTAPTGVNDWLPLLERRGFAVVAGCVEETVIAELVKGLAETEGSQRQRRGSLYARRNLLEEVPAVQQLAHSAPIRALVTPVLGVGAFAVRGLLFDKTPAANWKVAWHQDLAIAVRRRVEVPGFGAWSMKAGVAHVQPPAAILEQMLTVRLHLDDCGAENGPLQVLPGSQREGRLPAAEIRRWRERAVPEVCLVPRGGCVLMRPLLLHASSAAQLPGHRRVVHLEFTTQPLPEGLEWLAAGTIPCG